jgi:tetratricopeptide (TPR) repeat protein
MLMRILVVIYGVTGLLVPVCGWAAMDPWAESYRLEALTQYEGAAKALEKIIDQEPDNEFAVLRHGWLSYLRGAHNESIRDYQTALDINSKSLDARLGLMLPLIAQQRWREVASHANKVLEVAPWNYYAHVRLMISEEGEKKWESLAKHAQQVSQRYPSDATILVYLARANGWLKNNNEARRAYERVLERIPGHIEATQYLSR